MYAKLDQLILEAISLKKKPCHVNAVFDEAVSIVQNTTRGACRVIEGRLTALKKQGKIVYRKKQLNNGSGGWHVV